MGYNRKQVLKVLVTGTDGQAAQSIVKCLRMADSGTKFKVITTGVDPLLPGIYRGDIGYLVDKNWNTYLLQLKKISEEEKIDIIIPGSDLEIDVLSERRDELKVPILLADKKVIEIARDKLKTAEWLRDNNLHYPRTWKGLPLVNPFPFPIPYPVIIKHRKGWGSNDQYRSLNEEDQEALKEMFKAKELNEEDYITQELLNGTELSGMALVAKDGEILSITCAESIKKFGMSYKTIHGGEEDNLDFKLLVSKIVGKLGVSGPLSIQGFRTSNGIKIFEFNPRFTGAQVVRAMGGVNGPEILIENWLNGTKKYPIIKEKFIALWHSEYLYLPFAEYEKLLEKKRTKKTGIRMVTL